MDNAFKICDEHRWPRQELASSMQSSGSTLIKRCNNCVAVRVVFVAHLPDGTRVETIGVIIPD